MSEEAKEPVPRAAKPVKEMPKIRHGTVKGKIAAIQKAVAEIDSGARAIQAKISEQMKENQEAVAKMQSAVSEQMKENQEYVRDFYG